MHFAASKAVGDSVMRPLAYYENNIVATINLIREMEMNDVRNMVFSSSATVYIVEENVPCVEDSPTSPTNPYGWKKVRSEQILKDICRADEQWGAVILRYFNPIGAHESGLIGEESKGTPNNLLPYVAKVASGELPYVRIYGDDYDTIDGTGVRDYVHVMDIAEGHLLAMDYIAKRRGCHIFNLGTGKGSSVKEIIRAFEKVCEIELPWQIEDRRTGDLAEVYANVGLASQELGFNAHRSLMQMCEDSWRWQQNSIMKR
jgi:UDP-glucose 4-epimerase